MSFKLTTEQHNDIIDYYADSFEAKPILESVQSINDVMEDEEFDEVETEIYKLLDKFKEALLKLKK